MGEITGVDFVTVPTNDLDAAVAFYGETLGLPRSVYMPERGCGEFETGNLTLSVVVAENQSRGSDRTDRLPSAPGAPGIACCEIPLVETTAG